MLTSLGDLQIFKIQHFHFLAITRPHELRMGQKPSGDESYRSGGPVQTARGPVQQPER